MTHITLSFINGPLINSECDVSNRMLPFAQSHVLRTSIKYLEKITKGEDVKTVYKLGLSTKNINRQYQPGDTIGILAPNNNSLIERLLIRLNVERDADKPCEIQLSSCNNRKQIFPKHIPHKNTLRQILLHNVDVQSPPKKLFLKALMSHTSNSLDKDKLAHLCSPEGSADYMNFISGTGRSLTGLLDAFTSCQPPIELILEHLPPLLPRPYSISSSPLQDVLEITFFTILREDGSRGLCTSWLEDIAHTDTLIPFYFRQPSVFRLGDDVSGQVILVAAGTGIAPFRSFLQHKCLQMQYTCAWLFYGCRYSDRDFLYKDEICDYLKTGALTKLDVGYSREDEHKYVQDCIDENGAEVGEWILNGAQVFVCGNGKTMVKGVKSAIIKVLSMFGAMNAIEAEDYVSYMTATKKFNIDSWT